MGFRLPGKSIISGTSAHKSALKMKEASMAKRMEAAAKAMQKDTAAKAMAPNKAMESPAKAMKSPNKSTYAQAKAKDPNLDKYIKERKKYDAGSKEYEDLQAKINAAYGKKRDPKLKEAQVKKVEAKKSRNITSKVKDKPEGDLKKTIKKSNPKKAEGPREGTKKEKVDVAKKSVKDTKKEGKIKTLKAKKELAETKGRSKRAERLGRKIERKETGKTRREQRLERKLAKAKEKRTPATAMSPNKAMTPNKAMSPNKKRKLTDLSGDGKITQKDVLIGRGVIKK